MLEQVQRCYNRYKYTAGQWQWPYYPADFFSIPPRIITVNDRDNFLCQGLVTVNDRDNSGQNLKKICWAVWPLPLPLPLPNSRFVPVIATLYLFQTSYIQHKLKIMQIYIHDDIIQIFKVKIIYMTI